jgi:hypothetical protein
MKRGSRARVSPVAYHVARQHHSALAVLDPQLALALPAIQLSNKLSNTIHRLWKELGRRRVRRQRQ